MFNSKKLILTGNYYLPFDCHSGNGNARERQICRYRNRVGRWKQPQTRGIRCQVGIQQPGSDSKLSFFLDMEKLCSH